VLEVVTEPARPPVAARAALPQATDVQSSAARAHVRVAGDSAALAGEVGAALAAAGIRAIDVRPIDASLEDVFIDLITGGRS
jgi:hypothetical protein